MTPDRHGKIISIVMPVFNDWESLGLLLELIGKQDRIELYNIHVYVVDDCSSELPDTAALSARKGKLASVHFIRLACNLGPMRAIAVGLVAACQADVDAVIVMDADGEDRPEDVIRLIETWRENSSRIVVAQRAQRSEGFAFRAWYSIYKSIFRVLVGHTINFGSFCILPREALQALVHNPAIWNNLPATIIRSRMPFTRLQTNRGTRLFGKSRMNFESLAVHGVSVISVYADIVLLRIIVAMCAFATVVIAALVGVIVVRFATDLAVPGWASYIASSLIIIFIQSLVFAGVALFQLLSSRTLKVFIPIFDAGAFVVGSGYSRDGQGAKIAMPFK